MPSDFGSAVKQGREARGLSRKKLAGMTGLTEAKVWSIENGRTTSAEEHDALTRALNLENDPNFEWSPPPPTSPSTPVRTQAVVPSPPPPAPAQTADMPPLVVPSIGGGPVHEEGVRLISNSEIQTFKRCRRQWWLGWIRGFQPKTESPVGPAAVGGRIHRALRMHYLPPALQPMDPRAALERLIIDDWTALTQDGQPTLELKRRFDSEANLERIMLDGYLAWLAETGDDGDLEIVSSEAYVEAQLDVNELWDPEDRPFKEVRLIGRLDVRARRRTDGARVFIDHKTVASIAAKTRLLALDEQMLHYHLLEWLTREPGEPYAAGAVYNMLRRVKRTSGAKPPFYARVFVPHNEHELRSFKQRVTGTVYDLIEAEQSLRATGGRSHLTAAYPTQSQGCNWCPFLQVCPMFDDGSRAEDMLKAHYVEEDPLKYYQVEEVGSVEPEEG